VGCDRRWSGICRGRRRRHRGQGHTGYPCIDIDFDNWANAASRSCATAGDQPAAVTPGDAAAASTFQPAGDSTTPDDYYPDDYYPDDYYPDDYYPDDYYPDDYYPAGEVDTDSHLCRATG
jgi:hypothetical protein